VGTLCRGYDAQVFALGEHDGLAVVARMESKNCMMGIEKRDNQG
jgi:hypothetical protein